jgi:hypothetical protein
MNVVSNRVSLTVLGAEHMSPGSPWLIAEHALSHDDPGPHRGTDLCLLGAAVEEKSNRADRNLALIICRHQYRMEGQTR